MQLKPGEKILDLTKYRQSIEKGIEANHYPERYAMKNYKEKLEELEKALQDGKRDKI